MDKNLSYLDKIGIGSAHAKRVVPYHRNARHEIVSDFHKVKATAMDAATVPNVGIPSALVTYIDPKITEILFAKMAATEMFPEVRKGTWIDAFMTFPEVEIAGDVTPYSDFTMNVSSDVNVDYPSRENFIFETAIKYGLREQETGAQGMVEYAGTKQRGASEIIARAHNKFYLYGVAGKAIYGALNDPNLNPAITPINVSSHTTWADKEADGALADKIANVIYNDVNKMFNKLFSVNGGLVDANSPFVLAIAPDRVTYLTMPNAYGKTALEMLKTQYPNLTFVQVPELQSLAGSSLYLVVPELNGLATGETCYSEKLRMGNVETYSTSWRQKVFAGTWGCVIRRPSLIVTMTGI